MRLFSKDFLSEKEQVRIKKAIESAEQRTSGEIRLRLEPFCKIDVLDRSADVFALLHMHETEFRNGVLFYVAYKDRKFAIIGDAGINVKVGEAFWNEEKDILEKHFKENKYADGLEKAILLAGEKLQEHFPKREKPLNELSDEISFG